MFKLKPNESIIEMFTRFMDVVNGLEGLGNRVCHTPTPGPTRLADPNRVRGERPYIETLYLIFFKT